MLYGRGVGIGATSSLILRDLTDIATRIHNNAWRTEYNLSWNAKPVMPMQEVETSYYIRFPCVNRPGVIGEIARILGGFNINIGSAHAEVDTFKGSEFGFVHIFIEKTKEKFITKAIDKIKKQEIILDRIKMFRILEDI
jgi:homoserine dehydrogenase